MKYTRQVNYDSKYCWLMLSWQSIWRLAMFFQVEVKCLEDKNIDFKYTQCVFKIFFQIRKPINKKNLA
jgi:hypothetical protein